jgi:hypothetical protein
MDFIPFSFSLDPDIHTAIIAGSNKRFLFSFSRYRGHGAT